jgi:hypothetical protein
MRVVSVIIRFTQLLALLPIGIGMSFAESFVELLNGLAQGQPWDFAEFAKRLAAFSSPTGLGVALIVGLEMLLRKGRATHARSLRFPEQPWLWEPMWAERRVRLSNRTGVALCLGALFVYGFVMVPTGLWMASQKAAAVVYTFLGVFGLFILALMRMVWLNRRWGRSELEILTLPGVIGGPFRGVVILSESLPEGTPFRVTLNCIRHRTYRMQPSGDTETVKDTIWQDQKILFAAPPADRPDAIAILCSFAIPFSCEPTTPDTITFSSTSGPQPDVRVSINWQLSVGMKDTLDPRQATFAVPVFRTEDSSPDYRDDAAVDAPYRESVDVDALLETLPLQREYSTTGQRLRFSMFRTRDLVLMLVFTVAISVGVWAIFRYVSMPISLFAGLIPVVLAVASYGALLQGLTWQADITITEKATTITAGYFWSRRRYEYPRGKWPTLECHEEMRRESGSTYCVRMVPAVGPPCDIVKRLDGKQNAVAVRDWLVKVLSAG